MTWGVVLGSILVSLLVVEFTDWCPSIANGIVRLVARLLPASERDRYREEWLGEVDAVPGRLARVVKALALIFGVPALRGTISARASQEGDTAELGGRPAADGEWVGEIRINGTVRMARLKIVNGVVELVQEVWDP